MLMDYAELGLDPVKIIVHKMDIVKMVNATVNPVLLDSVVNKDVMV
jgi:hypothetical protein